MKNGDFSVTTSNQYIVGQVNWRETEVNTAENYSMVYAELRGWRTNNYTTTDYQHGFYIKINGTEFYQQNSNDRPLKLNSNTLLVSGTVKVPHNSDGTKTINISVRGQITTTIMSEQTGQAELSRIARASGVTAGEGTIGSNLNISINRADSSFTHTLSYSFGSLSGQIATGVGTSYSWVLPTSFYAQIPNSKSGQGTITCQTYSGGTLIGTSSCSFTAKCNDNDCKPSINVSFYDNNDTTVELTGSTAQNPVLVDYFSEPMFNISSTVKNSATKSQLYISSSTGTYSHNPDATTIMQKLDIYDAFSFTIVDSRRYSDTDSFQSNSSSQSGYFKRIPYTYLTLTATTKRSTQIANDMFVDLSGNYFKGNFSDTVSNTLALSWRVRERNGEWVNGATTLTPTISETENKYSISNLELINPISDDGTWDYQKIYEFEFTATDKLMNVTASDSRPKGQPNFVIFQDEVIIPNGILLKKEGFYDISSAEAKCNFKYNGKDVYCKIVSSTVPNNTDKAVSTGINSGYTIIKTEIIGRASNKVTIPIPYITTGGFIRASFWISGNQYVLELLTTYDASSYTAYATIYYIKE